MSGISLDRDQRPVTIIEDIFVINLNLAYVMPHEEAEGLGFEANDSFFCLS